ncbi:collectrin isoform X1 [Python bivittatus]|uniref:Collectrin isoform X1 n=1 Tax=Python bivittatus TaxID=176946 RepID=A0A9F5IS99_PYTBI|nr:collectrin isoform X1 [Python bivittatus]
MLAQRWLGELLLGGLLLASAWVTTIAYPELCQPDAQNAFKVRLSIKTALKENAYSWDATEEYLFKAMLAFAVRRYLNQETTQISNVLLCNVTSRVSFWFVVTDSSTNITTIPRSDVEAAIRMNRNRINNAFLLTDDTLQFLEIPSTLAPPVEQPLPTWLIIFGIILGITVIGIILVVSSGIYHRKRHNTNPEETEDLDDKCEAAITMENRIPCHILDLKAGQINGVYAAADDERFTPF